VICHREETAVGQYVRALRRGGAAGGAQCGFCLAAEVTPPALPVVGRPRRYASSWSEALD